MEQKFYKKFLHKFRGNIIGLSLLGMGASACGVYLAWLSKSVVDMAIGQEEGNLLQVGLLLVGVLILQLILQIGLTVLHVHTTTNLRFQMQTYLFDGFFQKSKQDADALHSGELVHRLCGDTGIVANAVAEILPSVFAIGARLILSFVALLMLDWALSLLCVAAGMLMLLAAYIYRRKTGDLFRQSREREGKIRAFIQETAQNFVVIRAFSVSGVMKRLLGKEQKEAYRLTVKTNRISIGATVCLSVAVTAAYYAVLAWGAWRIHRGLITFGTLTAILALTADISTPFQQLAALFPQYVAHRASVERLEEIERMSPEDVQDQLNPGHLYDEITSVCTENLSFAYPQTQVLENANVTFEKGKITAVTGASGAGKTTLLNLIVGVLTPQAGRVVAKDGNGNAISLAPYRSMFAYVPQDFLLLSGSILENITFFDETPDMAKVEEALQIAQLTELIQTLPDGIHTQLGEGGSRLSGGQRQRMAIARALYSPASILLMDESTSALTSEMEADLVDALRASGKTVIFVTHRKTAVDLSDEEYRVENGTVVKLK